jgi:hypothetical protein
MECHVNDKACVYVSVFGRHFHLLVLEYGA